MESPIHIGSRSLEFSLGIFTMLESDKSAIQIRAVWPPLYFFQAGCHWGMGA